ncbi:MAG: SufD family Fe-S cluster assembly protein [Parachlamydiales bacterium]|nr:SufD family Fe-S cluster assembly protein [Parachlamydiales bacterium]
MALKEKIAPFIVEKADTLVLVDGIYDSKSSVVSQQISITSQKERLLIEILAPWKNIPIEIIHCVTTTRSDIVATPISIILHASVQAIFVQHFEFRSLQPCAYRCPISFEMYPAAGCQYISFIESHENQRYYFDVSASLQKHSFFKTIDLFFGKGTMEHHVATFLHQEKGFVCLQGLNYLQGEGSVTSRIESHHLAPEGVSSYNYKNALYDRAKVSCRGNVIVAKEASNTSSRQMYRSLLLSSEAQAITKPFLEIFTEKVNASHGASISDFDEKALFYLYSRGFSQKEAQKILIEGFCQEILKCVKVKEVQEKMLQRLS